MVQTFYEHMVKFLKDINAKDVVEVGSDVQLKLAMALSSQCQRFYSVNFPEDHTRMQGWYEMAKEFGGATNLTLLSGNALQLPSLIKRADVVILQNVLIDGNGTDTDLLWKYRREELECTEELEAELVGRFRQAEEEAYKGFLQVAKPGHIIKFGRPEEGSRFRNMLVGKLGVEPARIQMRELLYDETRETWEAHFIDNS